MKVWPRSSPTIRSSTECGRITWRRLPVVHRWPSSRPGRTVFKEGGDADACYLIVDGDVALEIVTAAAGAARHQTLHAGEVLGWSWLFPPYRWSFDAQALTEAKAIRFDAADVAATQEG